MTDYGRAVRNVGRCVYDLWPNCHGRGVNRAWPKCHLAEPSVYQERGDRERNPWLAKMGEPVNVADQAYESCTKKY